MKRYSLLGLLALLATGQAFAQAVIFPQEKQAGTARLQETGREYVLENDLFSAAFERDGDMLLFAGCPEMGLTAGTELFEIETGSGKAVKASEMTLKEVRTLDLEGDPNAARGSERLPGKAVEATFTYNRLTMLWRAVLRDGSHYLRTELSLTASGATSMRSVTAMNYELAPASAAEIPAVVGNTRGAVLASEKIFAGLETPMGVNQVFLPGAPDEWDYNAWTPETFATSLGSDTPQAILDLGFTASQVQCVTGDLMFSDAGSQTVTFQYTSGTHRLNIVGVDIVNPETGKVVSSDYHIGYTGGQKSDNVYTLNIPDAGKNYLVRYFVETKTETITSSGTVTWSCGVFTPGSIQPTGGGVALQGLWERQTTLAAGKTWKVSSVVGLIAPGQARRSFLSYSERERAVPWRPFPVYVSWYELNIDRNNSRDYSGNMTSEQCVDVMNHWRTDFYDKYGEAPAAFVWDDGWDQYGTWTFNPNFPNGFSPVDDIAKGMGSGIGAWLGPVGGYGTSGDYRRDYWSNRGGMQLSNKAYYDTFYAACKNMIDSYDFRFFKFDGISAQWSSVGPDAGTTGIENAEGIISMEEAIREMRPDIFFNTTVGTWASPFWFHVSDAVWRQENDYGEIGNQGTDREKWITYRDRLVYQNFVQNSPLCPINTLMTHGFILTNFGSVSKNMTYKGVLQEMRCAFACGSGMVELYCDYALMNSINNGKLWEDLSECIKWQREQADVLPDTHWVGGNPWDGTKVNVYGWASWNGKKAVLALRNPSTSRKGFTFTLREALDIPDYVPSTTTITFTPAFEQVATRGLDPDTPIGIDEEITVSLAASSVFVWNGVQADGDPNGISSSLVTRHSSTAYDLQGRIVFNGQRSMFNGQSSTVNGQQPKGIYIVNGEKKVY